ncbi:hypothetical protein L2E82_31313 [Cichorium intybus]|uniref:Uncharacterized protein n=1 Tax=Cichorium intybus TaxID=13427 RepID=A0ACB9D2N5_CICIN|nr:hypothetical protein L2E82_31313 [Cichorium intybus]
MRSGYRLSLIPIRKFQSLAGVPIRQTFAFFLSSPSRCLRRDLLRPSSSSGDSLHRRCEHLEEKMDQYLRPSNLLGLSISCFLYSSSLFRTRRKSTTDEWHSCYVPSSYVGIYVILQILSSKLKKYDQTEEI